MYWKWCFCMMVFTRVAEGIESIVHTEIGDIHGLTDEKDKIDKFLGIPYAFVDVMDPFGPANLNVHFETPYYAVKDPAICPQIVNGTVQGNIQCLNLNVYKPIIESQMRPLPVMVFIHGGGFVEGDGNIGTYSPTFLLKHNVILVTINYRLGPYGFLCLEDDGYKNQALNDQFLALKWVNKYIKAFGGDKNNILLFGHSAGSGCVDFHLSNNGDKLFHKVILQSAVKVSPLISLKPKRRDYLATIAGKLGLLGKEDKTKDIIKRLSGARTDLVINATKNDIFRPCVDGSIKDEHDLKDVKIIIGNTDKETIFFYKDVINYTNFVKKEIKTYFDNITDSDIEKVENVYLKNNTSIKDGIYDFGVNFLFNHPVERTVRHYLRKNATVYRYVFSYDGGRNFVKIRDKLSGKGATHGDELGYLFDIDILKGDVTPEDEAVIIEMTSLWTTFAKYGEPSPSFLGMSPWEPAEPNADRYLEIGVKSQLFKGRYREDKMEFWDSFFKDFGVKYNALRYTDEPVFSNAASKLVGALILVTATTVVRLTM